MFKSLTVGGCCVAEATDRPHRPTRLGDASSAMAFLVSYWGV